MLAAIGGGAALQRQAGRLIAATLQIEGMEDLRRLRPLLQRG